MENEPKIYSSVNKQIIIIILLMILIFGSLFAIYNFLPPQNNNDFLSKSDSRLELQSSVFVKNGYLPPKYTCDGTNVNPSLEILHVPPEAKSLVLIMEDLDASVSDFTNWLMWNISPETKIINEGVMPTGAIAGKNDWGENKYNGPCPSAGTHHYSFKLYAVDFVFDKMSPNTNKEKILTLLTGHILGKAEMTGLYGR